jgi:ABC-type transporter Mla MlaB component
MIAFFAEPTGGLGGSADPADVPMGPVRLSVMGEATWPTYRVSLIGSLDSETLIAFEIQFDQSTCDQFELVILDVSGLTGLDQAGADALARFRQHVERGGGTVHTEGSARAKGGGPLAEPRQPGEVLD